MTDRTHADLRGDDNVAASVRIARAVLAELTTAPADRVLAGYATTRLTEQLNWSPARIAEVVRLIGCPQG